MSGLLASGSTCFAQDSCLGSGFLSLRLVWLLGFINHRNPSTCWPNVSNGPAYHSQDESAGFGFGTSKKQTGKLGAASERGSIRGSHGGLGGQGDSKWSLSKASFLPEACAGWGKLLP